MLCGKWYAAFSYSVVDFFYLLKHAKSSTGLKLELFYSILQAEEWEEVVEERNPKLNTKPIPWTCAQTYCMYLY